MEKTTEELLVDIDSYFDAKKFFPLFQWVPNQVSIQIASSHVLDSSCIFLIHAVWWEGVYLDPEYSFIEEYFVERNVWVPFFQEDTASLYRPGTTNQNSPFIIISTESHKEGINRHMGKLDITFSTPSYLKDRFDRVGVDSIYREDMNEEGWWGG